MPVPTGYYDVNRNAIARGMTTPSQKAVYFDEKNPLWQSYVNNPAYQGMDFRDYMLTPVATSTDTTQYETSPGSNDYWSPADIGGGYALQITPEAQLRKSRDARNAQDNVALTFAAIAGGAAAAGAGGGSAAAGGAAPEAAGSAAGLSEVAVPSAGAYLPAESLSSAAAPTLGMTAPTAESVGAGTGGAGGFDWQGMLKHANPFGGSGEGGSPQYGDYSRIAEQLSRNQLQDQRKQVMAQQQAQGPSLQERRRQRIAALLQAGSPA